MREATTTLLILITAVNYLGFLIFKRNDAGRPKRRSGMT